MINSDLENEHKEVSLLVCSNALCTLLLCEAGDWTQVPLYWTLATCAISA